MGERLPIGVLASGAGTNLQALLDSVHGREAEVVAVEPGTPLQVRNEAEEELVLYVYGAPPQQAGADFFPDVPL